MPEDRTAYCVEGCGRPARTSRPLAITADSDLVSELVCWQCADTWFSGRTRCPDCWHYCADHAACSPEPGGAGPMVDCSCGHDCHLV